MSRMVIPSSAYGMGPVFDALPDIKTLNELKRLELAAADVYGGARERPQRDGGV